MVTGSLSTISRRVEGGLAALHLVVEGAELLDRLVAEIEGGDDGEERRDRCRRVGVEEGAGDADGGDDLDGGAEGLGVFGDLELEGEQIAAAAAKRPVSRSSRLKARTSRAAARFSANWPVSEPTSCCNCSARRGSCGRCSGWAGR
jgi:hypothetical protein